MELGLSLGSNLGDRLGYLQAARDAVSNLVGVRVAAQSPVYETEPVDVRPEYADLAYLNAVLILETERPVADVHRELARIEADHGRVRRGDRFAPRTMDIDVLYAGDLVSDSGKLTLPHPRWASRRFVVQPLADVRPDLVVAGMTRPVRDCLRQLPDVPRVTLFAMEW